MLQLAVGRHAAGQTDTNELSSIRVCEGEEKTGQQLLKENEYEGKKGGIPELGIEEIIIIDETAKRREGM